MQALSYQVLRSLARAQALVRLMASRAPQPAVEALLCVALALLWKEEDCPYDTFTLVDQAVEAAKRQPATRVQAGFVNGCLRRFLRERAALVDASSRDPEVVWNHPGWWMARLRRDHPQQWQHILQADNQHAPLCLRVNARRSSRDDYLALLAQAGVAASPVGEYGVLLQRATAVAAIPGFADGVVSVQDAAAQMAAPLLLQGSTGQPRVLDACAAPGGKTAHLLEISDAQVTALDIDAQRCERIQGTLQRLGLQAQVLTADAAQPAAWWDGVPFDAILLDAPCTASGIVRRHPDVPWLRRESDVAQLARVQAALLQALWPLMRPGGRMLYCTCSVFLQEGQDQIQTFVAHNTDAVLQASPGHLLPTAAANRATVPDNPAGDHDGFFYALLEKRAQGVAAPLA